MITIIVTSKPTAKQKEQADRPMQYQNAALKNQTNKAEDQNRKISTKKTFFYPHCQSEFASKPNSICPLNKQLSKKSV